MSAKTTSIDRFKTYTVSNAHRPLALIRFDFGRHCWTFRDGVTGLALDLSPEDATQQVQNWVAGITPTNGFRVRADVCAWCGWNDHKQAPGLSHGFCPTCYLRMADEVKGLFPAGRAAA